MAERTPDQRILWLGRRHGPQHEALFEELRRHEPDAVWIVAGGIRRIGSENPALIHAFGPRALRTAVLAARRLRCRVVYEPDLPGGSLTDRLVQRIYRPDAVIRRVLDTNERVGAPPASVPEISLPVTATPLPANARLSELAELYVGIVVDGLGRRDRRLLARALSWVPRARGIICLLFGSGDDCRRMRRALKLQSLGDDAPARFVERDRPRAEDWVRCAVTYHTMRSTASEQMLADALVAGTAVIMHDTVSVPAVVDNESGLCIPPFNPFDLCHSLQYLREQPGLLRSLAKRGHAQGTQHYSVQAVVPLLLAAYGRLLGGEDPAQAGHGLQSTASDSDQAPNACEESGKGIGKRRKSVQKRLSQRSRSPALQARQR